MKTTQAVKNVMQEFPKMMNMWLIWHIWMNLCGLKSFQRLGWLPYLVIHEFGCNSNKETKDMKIWSQFGLGSSPLDMHWVNFSKDLQRYGDNLQNIAIWSTNAIPHRRTPPTRDLDWTRASRKNHKDSACDPRTSWSTN